MVLDHNSILKVIGRVNDEKNKENEIKIELNE
jgi:hypothetical protein